jgi:hypothetical protein
MRRSAFFDRHRAQLLHLATVDEFLAGCGG